MNRRAFLGGVLATLVAPRLPSLPKAPVVFNWRTYSVPIVVDRSCPPGMMYLLNMKIATANEALRLSLTRDLYTPQPIWRRLWNSLTQRP